MDFRMIVGLGNPGRKYQQHRHNIGFRVLEAWAEREQMGPWRSSCQAEIIQGELAEVPVILAKPQTFMNRSGESVFLLLRKFRSPIESMIVIHDDLDLERGCIKLKQGGGHGGHNGLRSIIEQCGADFIRLRIGIGRPDESQDPAEYVLMKFSDPAEAREGVKRAVDIVEYLLLHGLGEAMNHFHS